MHLEELNPEKILEGRMLTCWVISAAFASPISIDAALTSSNLGLYGVSSSISSPLGAAVLGADIGFGQLRYMNIAGQKSLSGARGRLRGALLLPVVGGDGFWFDVALTAGLRGLTGETGSALAVTSEVGPAVHAKLGERFTFSAITLLPFAVDALPAVALARFPGIVLGAGGIWRAGERLGVGLSGFAGAPEGYNGDSEKGLVEGRLTLRFDLDGGVDRVLLLPSAI